MISLITVGYCSMTLGVLQISSTTRNLVPRFKRWSKGKDSGRTELNTRKVRGDYVSERGIEASLELKFKKVIESKVRCNKELQPGRQSFVA